MRGRPSFSTGSISTFATSASAPTLPSVAFNLYLRATFCRFGASSFVHSVGYLAPLIFQTSITELPCQLPGVSSSELSLAHPSPELRISAKNALQTHGAAVHGIENWSERIPIGLKEFCAPAFTSQAWRDACFSCVELTTMYFAFYHAQTPTALKQGYLHTSSLFIHHARRFRQSDAHLIKCLGKLRVGVIDEEVCRHFGETLARQLQPSNGLVATRLTCKNDQAVR